MAEPGPGLGLRARGAAAARFWRALDLAALRQELDLREVAISEHVERSVLSRKRLAQETKAFRRLADTDDKLKKLGPLLRGYQEDIDRLTKRARYAEGAFLELYKSLFDAPDPSDLLEALAEQDIEGLQEENARLRREIEEYDEEFAALKNQDIYIRKLEKDLANLREASDASLKEALQSKESDLKAENESRYKEAEARETAVREALNVERARIEDLQEALERSQEEVFELRASIEEAEAARQAETDLVGEDLARANARIADLQLKLREVQGQSLPGSAQDFGNLGGAEAPGAADRPARKRAGQERDRERVLELEDELVRKSELEESLRDEITSLRRSMRDAERVHEATLAESDEALRRVKDDLFRLKAQLKERPTQKAYNQLRRQVELLQAVDVDEEGGKRPSTPNAAEDADAGDDSFNSHLLVLKRVRKLEATAASLRVQLDAEKAAHASADAQRQQAEETVQDLRTELTNLQQESKASIMRRGSGESFFRRSNQVGEENALGGRRRRSSTSSSGRRDGSLPGATDETETEARDGSAAANLLLAATEDVGLVGASLEESSASADSMLNIVQAQRNEFRNRMLELESERDDLSTKLLHAEQDTQTLRTDNVNLLEKIRYLQSYGGSTSSDASALSSPFEAQREHHEIGRLHPNQRPEVRVSMPTGLQQRAGFGGGLAADVSEARYRQAYEDKLNPFSDFSARERRRRLHGLNLPERVTYQAMTMIASNKYMRLGVFIYALALHILVFFALSMSTTSGCLDAATPSESVLMPHPADDA